jgi:maltose O-acetyltransferase
MNESPTWISFLREKLKDLSLKKLFYQEIEGWMYWSCKNLPGVIGFMSRNIVVSLLCKKKGGMIWLQPEINLVHINKLKLGSNVGINSGSYINAIGGIEMGNFVLIGSNVTISSGIHPIDGVEPAIFCRPVHPKKIVIEDDCWIAAGASILAGVTLAKGTVVGANSVVTKNTEAYSVVVGAPARKVKSRYDEGLHDSPGHIINEIKSDNERK